MRCCLSFVILIIVAAILVGCEEKHDARLEELDSALWRNPDSVYPYIVQFDTANINSEKDRYYWKLLLAEANDKTDREDTTLFIAKELENYYIKNKHDQKLIPRVFYRIGRIMVMRHEDDKALEYFRKALLSLRGKTDPELYICIHSQISDLFCRNSLYESSLIHAEKQLEYSRLKGDSTDIIQSSLVVASILRYLYETDKARNIYDSVGRMIDALSDITLETQYATQFASFLMDQGKYKIADSVIRSRNIEVGERTHPSVKTILNRLALNAGRNSGVEETSSALLDSSTNIYARKRAAYNLATVAESRGETKKALEYTNRFISLSDSISRLEGASTIAQLDRLYSTSEMEEEIDELMGEKKSHKTLATIFILFFLILCLDFIYYKVINKDDRAHKDFQHSAEIKSLSDKLDSTRIEIDRNISGIEYITNQIADRDREIENIKKEIADRDREIEHKKNEIADKNIAIKNLVKEVEISKRALKKQCEEKESKKRELDVLNKKYEDEKNRFDEELRKIRQDRDKKAQALSVQYSGMDESAFRKKFITEFKSDRLETFMHKLEEYVKSKDPDFYKAMEKQDLKIHEFHDTLLLRIGMSLKECATTLNVSTSCLKMRRERLWKNKGLQMKGKNWEEYVFSFSSSYYRNQV